LRHLAVIFTEISQELEGEPAEVKRFVAAVVGAGFIVIAALASAGGSVGNAWSVLALCLIAAIAEKGSIRVTNTTQESISLLPTLFAAVLFGPLAAAAVGAASMVSQFRSPYLAWAVYTSSRSITGAIAGLVALAALALPLSGIGAIAVATAAGAIIAETLDVGFAALAHRVRRNGRVRQLLRKLAPLQAASLPLFVPMVILLVVAYVELSPWTLALFFAPALAAQRLYGMYQEQRRLADDVQQANVRLERANLSFATALVATLDARDRYTAGHSAAVAIYARDIARRLDLSEAQQQLAHLCGLVHDIGKVGLPPSVLEKAGALTLDERRMMERHSEIGEGILANVDDYAEIAAIVRHHHERVDGNGYPDRLVGDEIPMLSRIIAVADAYNAMTSHRPYRDAMPSRVARLRLAQAADSQFDTGVVAAFEALLAGADEDYRLGLTADFGIESAELPAFEAQLVSLSA
jgi:putative nucleotidyltransferase with HDIG domain